MDARHKMKGYVYVARRTQFRAAAIFGTRRVCQVRDAQEIYVCIPSTHTYIQTDRHYIKRTYIHMNIICAKHNRHEGICLGECHTYIQTNSQYITRIKIHMNIICAKHICAEPIHSDVCKAHIQCMCRRHIIRCFRC